MMNKFLILKLTHVHGGDGMGFPPLKPFWASPPLSPSRGGQKFAQIRKKRSKICLFCKKGVFLLHFYSSKKFSKTPKMVLFRVKIAKIFCFSTILSHTITPLEGLVRPPPPIGPKFASPPLDPIFCPRGWALGGAHVCLNCWGINNIGVGESTTPIFNCWGITNLCVGESTTHFWSCWGINNLGVGESTTPWNCQNFGESKATLKRWYGRYRISWHRKHQPLRQESIRKIRAHPFLYFFLQWKNALGNAKKVKFSLGPKTLSCCLPCVAQRN